MSATQAYAKRNGSASVAAAGTNQATATAVTAQFTTVTGADGTKGVILPSPRVSGEYREQHIYNSGTSPLKVYPPVGSTLNDESANTSITVGPSTIVKLLPVSATAWRQSGSNGGFELTFTYSSGTGSYQPVAVDLKMGGAVGGEGKKLAPIMGHAIDLDTPATMTQKNIVGGVIGAYGVTAAQDSTYPVGAVLAQVSDGVNDADVNGVVAYIDGDSSTTVAGAAFKVKSNNSTAASGFNFGVDLQDAAHDGYQAVDRDFYLKAPIRVVNDVVFLVGSGAPVNGTTGDNVAGPGSLYIDIAAGNIYINTGTITDGVWKLITRAA